jgi:iron complex transport system permease protein
MSTSPATSRGASTSAAAVSTTTTIAGDRGRLPTGHRRRRRLFIGFVVATVALLVVFVLSLMLGSNLIAPGSVLHALLHYDKSDAASLIVVDSRLPRTLLGLTAGVALGLAGTVMQGLSRNPLADPGILGVNFGASLAVVVAISVFGITSASGYVWFAFAGAAVASVVVYAVASAGREGATPIKLALAGAAVSAVLGSLITAVLVTSRVSLDALRFWQVGSLAGRGFGILWQVLPTVVLGAVVALALGRVLNGLALGDDVARGLGQRVGLSRAASALAVVLLCGSATAAVGPIAFVGLVVPHVARAVVGGDYRWILAFSAVVAPTLLIACDVIGRLVSFPGELQVGVVTALVGAPVFIALVRRRKLVTL